MSSIEPILRRDDFFCEISQITSFYLRRKLFRNLSCERAKKIPVGHLGVDFFFVLSFVFSSTLFTMPIRLQKFKNGRTIPLFFLGDGDSELVAETPSCERDLGRCVGFCVVGLSCTVARCD